MKDFLVITGTPRTDMLSWRQLKPPPVAICPHMAARLRSQWQFVPLQVTLDDVGNRISVPHPLHRAVRVEASHLKTAHIQEWVFHLVYVPYQFMTGMLLHEVIHQQHVFQAVLDWLFCCSSMTVVPQTWLCPVLCSIELGDFSLWTCHHKCDVFFLVAHGNLGVCNSVV